LSLNKLIVHADDLGLSRAFNTAILEAAKAGFLTSTCLRVNGSAYEEAIKEVLPECPELGMGLHLNLVEGKTTKQCISNSSELYFTDGTYRLGFVGLYRGRKSKNLLQEIEGDYRDQIERALKVCSLDHFNSHQHSHAIPELFEIVCRLAKEYGIRYVRLPQERFYYAAPLSRHLTPWYGVNLAKFAILNAQAKRNIETAKKHGILTNDYFVGISYTARMDENTLLSGLKALEKATGLIEVLFHPTKITAEKDERYLSAEVRDYIIDPARAIELTTLQNAELLKTIKSKGIHLTNYRRLAARDNSPIVPKFRVPKKIQKPFNTFVIIDETPFYHPEYLYRLITECPEMNITGAALVCLPKGGVLKNYLLKHWRDLGLRELFLLGMKQILMQVWGKFPRFMRGNFDASVEAVLKRFNIPFRVVTKVNNAEFLNYLEPFSPDIILSSNSLIFGEKLINKAKVACINRHSAVLPACGGILPVFRAIEQGHNFTGATVHHVIKEIDKGKVLSRQWLPLFPQDRLNHLYRLCFVLSYEATNEAVKRLHKNRDDHVGNEEITPSYFSYPTSEEWKKFRQNGGKFI